MQPLTLIVLHYIIYFEIVDVIQIRVKISMLPWQKDWTHLCQSHSLGTYIFTGWANSRK